MDQFKSENQRVKKYHKSLKNIICTISNDF